MPINLRGGCLPLAVPCRTRSIVLLLCALLPLLAPAQNLSLSLQHQPLEQAFRQIEQQVPQRFVYTRQMMEQSKPVSLKVQDLALSQVLELLFQQQPLAYSLDDAFIRVRFKEVAAAAPAPSIRVSGQVINGNGQPLAGVTVRAARSGQITLTDEQGRFVMDNIPPNDVLHFSSVGYGEKRMAASAVLRVLLDVQYNALDETIIMAYGTTTRKLNTGNITRVGAEAISKQPVSNPVAALYGRVPGLVITQSSGVPGGKYRLEIRGRNSIVQGSEPLIIIDGVPFAPGNDPMNRVANTAGPGGSSGLSALNTLNPADIESMEILKDADATAIYGSRGANGVILITTKKGQAGETKVEASVYSGGSRITRTMDMLNTKEYLQMRREAFANDGLSPTADLAPDVALWDTTRYTDFKQLLLGGTAYTTDAQLKLSGGNSFTRFLLSGGFHRETTVFPGSLSDRKVSMLSNLSHSSPDRKFSVNFSAQYASEQSNLLGTDLSAFLNLPPNLLLYDAGGKPAWSEGGTSYGMLGLTNPMAVLEAGYTGTFAHVLGNLIVQYRVLPGLNLRLSGGFNSLTGNEEQINPSTAIDPVRGLLPYASFGNSTQRSWIAEPQAEYRWTKGRHQIALLAGATLQAVLNKGTSIAASDYTSDLLLRTPSAAGILRAFQSYSEYRYTASFGRVSYSYADQYLFNLSGRRDGSSRFGPNRRFSNFGAAGAAWIFSAAKGVQKALPFLSFGKLRGSFGITGNDQIGDYQFLQTWTASGQQPYQGVPGLRPSSLFNPDYGWEENRKLEGALELGFWEDRIFLSAAYFRNRSGNQLVNYTLPVQTGFFAVTQNIGAEIQNTGLELLLSGRFGSKGLQWNPSLTFTANRNKLLSFPGLERSSYAQNYVVGEPLSTRKLLPYEGVDPQTGIYRFTDVNRDGSFTLEDRVVHLHTDPRFYGGFVNTLRWRGLELEVLVEYRKQRGLNYLFTQSQYIPGYFYFNQPRIVLDRWQRPGQPADIQRFAATGASDAYLPAAEYLPQSEAVYGDASFIRVKNVSLSYALPEGSLRRLHLRGASVYLRAQNIATFTNYAGADPENQNLYVLPPLKTLIAGLQLQF